MNPKIIKLISTITFWIGIALTAVSVYMLITSGALAGACPLVDGRPFMIAAVVFLVASFVTSFFTGKKSKDKENKHD